MDKFITLEQIDEVAATIRKKVSVKPEYGIILGSGLGRLADSVENKEVVPTSELPYWPQSTVLGHSGKLVFGNLEGKPVMVLQGRSHYYEGYPMDQVVLPVRVMQRMGVKTLVVTNAAGAINPDFDPGDFNADHGPYWFDRDGWFKSIAWA